MRIEITGRVDVLGIRADNPGPLTLEGTNTWIVGSTDIWVVDPGPELAEHADAVAAEVSSRGRFAGIALTHGHGDHSDAVPLLLERLGPVPVIAGLSGARRGQKAGDMEVVSLPGHCADHIAFAHEDIVFTGDAIFADSSVFVSPGAGSLAGYLAALGELRDRGPRLLAPGHGWLIEDPQARINEQLEHRLDRERRLVEAIEAGHTSIAEVLSVVWDDVPDYLLPAATVTLAAHLDKLHEEGRLPEAVERPDIPEWVV
ncbi:MAG: MBL fold metallo-hydrolase [Actinomycetes bacterium]